MIRLLARLPFFRDFLAGKMETEPGAGGQSHEILENGGGTSDKADQAATSLDTSSILKLLGTGRREESLPTTSGQPSERMRLSSGLNRWRGGRRHVQSPQAEQAGRQADEVPKRVTLKEVIGPLPDKPLAECGVEDLKDLSEAQLEAMLFDASIYADRRFNIIDMRNKYVYDFQVRSPFEVREQEFGISPSEIIVGESDTDDKLEGYKKVDISLPYAPHAGRLEDMALPIINRVLIDHGDTPIDPDGATYPTAVKELEAYWSSNSPFEALRKNYKDSHGDASLFNEYETLQGILAKEVQDLQALGLDFDDIVKKIDPLIESLRASMNKARSQETQEDQDSQESDTLTFHVTKKNETVFTHVADQDADIEASSKIWKYNVIPIPFKGIERSIVDHRISHPSQRGWTIPLSETSASLYKHRIVEGYHMPHYRISAARAVWALEIGTPEQQAQALALDWHNTAEALRAASQRVDKPSVNYIMNYMIDNFPRDDSRWREHGFEGYKYDGDEEGPLRDTLVKLKERYKDMPNKSVAYPLEVKDID